MSVYLGDFAADATIYFLWSTNAADGSSITRQDNGVIRVYKNDNTTFTTSGITDIEDFDSVIGIHSLEIDTSSDAFYVTSADYEIVIVDVKVDNTANINAVLASFSITNRA